MRKYIAFEGLDLSGKTTIINNIKLKRSEYIYTKEPGGFNNDLSLKIRDLILNYKDQYAKAVYNQMINLSIVYLIVIGGFHLSILKKVINFCFKKHFKIALIVNLLLIFFYS